MTEEEDLRALWKFTLELFYSGHSGEAWDFISEIWPEDSPVKEKFII